MPKLILTSKSAIWDSNQVPRDNVVEALREAHEAGSEIFVVANHSRPSYWNDGFGFLRFQECGFKPPRQSGKIVANLLEANKDKGLRHADIIVLGADDEDMLMAVNSRSLLIRCQWAAPLPGKIAHYGVPFLNPAKIPKVITLLEDTVPWFFQHDGDFLSLYALTNAGTKFEVNARIIELVNQLKGHLKKGSPHLHKAFALHFLSSVYTTPGFEDVDWWGFYPSSDSTNDESEVMAKFCRLTRETYKKRTHGPLFIRHEKSPKRHIGTDGDRTDATSQLATVHLNPAYRYKLFGKTVGVLDDYLTYGVSFAVASALLKKAGVTRVVGAAMGKFGNCANEYAIEIKSDDPFQPLTDFSSSVRGRMDGEYDAKAQESFLEKFTGLM